MGSSTYVRNDVISISTFTFLLLFLIQPITAQLGVFPYCVTSCAGRATGQYANCFSCRMFVYCSNERLYNSPCLGILEYDAVRGVCDYPLLSDCRTSSATSATASMTSPTTTSLTSQASVTSPISVTSPTSRFSESSPSSETSQQSLQSMTSQSSEASLSSDSSQSSQSSQSSRSSAQSQTSEYSPTSAVGDVYCATSCSSLPSGLFPNCLDCSQYYQCLGGGVGYLRDCAPGTVFNPDDMQCDFPDNVVCATVSDASKTSEISVSSPTSGSSPDSETSESSQSSPSSVTSLSSAFSPLPECLETCGSQSDGDYPYCFGCNKFVRCQAGSTMIRECAGALVFSAEFRTCALESNCTYTSTQSQTSETSNTFVCTDTCLGLPSGDWAACDNCASYYRCDGSDGGTRKMCSSGLEFNPDVSRCDVASIVNCTFTSETSMSSPESASSESSLASESSEFILCVLTCTGTPSGDFAACDICQDFFRCDGTDGGSRMSCSSGLEFNPYTNNCAPDNEVACTFTSPSSQSSASSPSSGSSETSEQSEISDSSASSPMSPSSDPVYCVDSCANVPFGDWPSCDECMDYYRCDGTGNGMRRSCSVTLQFDPVTQQCAPEGDVDCQVTSPSSQSSPASPSSPTSMTSVTSSLSLTSGSSHSSPSSQSSQTSESAFCVDSCDSLPMGDYPACDDCRSFYRCIGGEEKRQCASILLFDPDTRQCDVAASVTCATTSASSQTSQSSASSEPSDQSDASSSSDTSDQSVTSRQSPISDSSPFSESSLSSEPSVTSEQSDQSDTSEQSQTSEAIDCVNSCVGTPMGDYLNCGDCTSFYRCDGSDGGELRSCSSGLLFSVREGRCDYANMVVCLTTSATSASSEGSDTSASSDSSPSSPQSPSSPTSAQSIQSVTSEASVSSGTSGVSEAVYCLTDCGDHPAGRYPDCDDCFYFHVCRGPGDGGPRSNCGVSGLLYDPSTEQCNIAANVVCATRSPSSAPSESSETSVTSEQPSPSSPTSLSSETSESSVTSESSHSSQSSEASDTSRSSATSPISYTSESIFCLTYSSTICSTYNLRLVDLAECASCQDYIRCDANGNSQQLSCSPTLRFNPDTLLCDFAANVAACATTSATSASSRTSMSSPTSISSETSIQSVTSETSASSMTSEAIFCVTSCSTTPIGDWPDCDDCGSFYRCDGAGSGPRESCGSDLLLFNPAIYDCDLFSNVMCATTSGSSATSDTSAVSVSPESETSVQSVTSASSEGSDSSEAVFCVTSCDGIPFGRYADCNSCSGFYSCGITNVMQTCGVLFFNPLTTACDVPGNVVCATTSASSATSEPSEQSVTSFTPSATSATSEESDQSDLSITSETSPSSERIDCISTLDACDNIAIGDYTYCSDRSMFVRCGVDTNVLEDCGAGLIFDGQICTLE